MTTEFASSQSPVAFSRQAIRNIAALGAIVTVSFAGGYAGSGLGQALDSSSNGVQSESTSNAFLGIDDVSPVEASVAGLVALGGLGAVAGIGVASQRENSRKLQARSSPVDSGLV